MKMFRWKPYCTTLWIFTASAVTLTAQTAVLTAQFDNARTGATLKETILNTSNVNVSSFGKLNSFTVDGYVFAQPLYVPNLKIKGSTINVLFVATMHNSIYAFDADKGTQLFRLNLGRSVPQTSSPTTLPCPTFRNAGPELGILSTPVIDLSTNTLYAVSATPASGGSYTHRLFAINIKTGRVKLGPVGISASVPGTGTDSQGGQVIMNNTRYIQRPGLLLTNGTIYAGFGGCGPDPSPYHGWILGYSASTLQQAAVYNASPNTDEVAIWQSGRGLVANVNGDIYAMTGNGPAGAKYANSFVKISSGGILSNWFTPSNQALLNQYDLDLSSSGPILTPDTNVLLGGGKYGVVHVLDPSSLLKKQEFQATTACGTPTFNGCFQIHSIAYLSGESTVYVWGVNDVLRAYQSTSGQFRPASQNAITVGYPGGTLAISSYAGRAGTSIVWAVTPDSVVHAFDATNVANELWNSSQNSARDSLGKFAKFGQPTIADGKVFVPTFANTVVKYGLLP